MAGMESRELAVDPHGSVVPMNQDPVQDDNNALPQLTFLAGAKKGENASALEKMKIRCFQTATDFVAKGQYQEALDQIRYVVEIEPSNPIVRDFERRVVALAMSKGDSLQPKAETEGAQATPAPVVEKELMPKSVLAIVVVIVIAIAGLTGYYFASRTSAPTTPTVILKQP